MVSELNVKLDPASDWGFYPVLTVIEDPHPELIDHQYTVLIALPIAFPGISLDDLVPIPGFGTIQALIIVIIQCLSDE